MPSVASAPTGWTIRVGFVTLALFAFAYGVCYGATIAPRPAVIADHFAGPDLAAVTGLHYTSSVLGPLVGPAAFGYSVDFWNGDLIASCVAAACLIAAGYFFAAKPPRVRLRREGVCRPQQRHAKLAHMPVLVPETPVTGQRFVAAELRSHGVIDQLGLSDLSRAAVDEQLNTGNVLSACQGLLCSGPTRHPRQEDTTSAKVDNASCSASTTRSSMSPCRTSREACRPRWTRSPGR